MGSKEAPGEMPLQTSQEEEAPCLGEDQLALEGKAHGVTSLVAERAASDQEGREVKLEFLGVRDNNAQDEVVFPKQEMEVEPPPNKPAAGEGESPSLAEEPHRAVVAKQDGEPPYLEELPQRASEAQQEVEPPKRELGPREEVVPMVEAMEGHEQGKTIDEDQQWKTCQDSSWNCKTSSNQWGEKWLWFFWVVGGWSQSSSDDRDWAFRHTQAQAQQNYGSDTGTKGPPGQKGEGGCSSSLKGRATGASNATKGKAQICA